MKLRNEKGFTLIEMMIVLLVISILMIITIPNLTKNQEAIKEKGCDAYMNMVAAQVEVYHMEMNVNPTIVELRDGGYIPNTACPTGAELTISSTGEVTIEPETSS